MQLGDIFSGIKESIKILVIAVFISFLGYSYINFFLVPNEKILIDELSKIENSISSYYDETIHAYIDIETVNKLQKMAVDIQYNLQKAKMIRIFLTGLLLVTQVGILAWWLQYIFTDIKFKDSGKENYSILAYSLLCATIIVGLVYYVTMVN